MSQRGRPRLGDAALTSAERKKRFDQKMRNAGGVDPSQPERSPCVLYLSEQAREVLREERALASSLEMSPASDSLLVERLLVQHRTKPSADRRAGLSLDDLWNGVGRLKGEFSKREEEIKRLRAMLDACKRRTVLPTGDLVVEAVAKKHIGADEHLRKLEEALRAVLLHDSDAKSRALKLRGLIDSHLRRIFGLP